MVNEGNQNKTESRMESIARQGYESVMKGFSADRLKRLSEPLTWSEEIVNEDVQFEFDVLEITNEYIHAYVDITIHKGNDLSCSNAHYDDIIYF